MIDVDVGDTVEMVDDAGRMYSGVLTERGGAALVVNISLDGFGILPVWFDANGNCSGGGKFFLRIVGRMRATAAPDAVCTLTRVEA